jgi:hypothetical protein
MAGELTKLFSEPNADDLKGTLRSEKGLGKLIFEFDEINQQRFGFSIAFLSALSRCLANGVYPTKGNEGEPVKFSDDEQLEAYMIQIILASPPGRKMSQSPLTFRTHTKRS